MRVTTVPPRSIVAAAERQALLIVKMAKQCETMGYFFALHGLNGEAINDKPFGYFVGGMGAYVETWARNHGRKYIRINVFHYGTDKMHFKFRILRTARLRPIIVALEMFGRRRTGTEKTWTGSGMLDCHERSNFFEVSGKGTDALEIACNVLNMPHHRAILTRQYRPKLAEVEE